MDGTGIGFQDCSYPFHVLRKNMILEHREGGDREENIHSDQTAVKGGQQNPRTDVDAKNFADILNTPNNKQTMEVEE